MSPGSSERRLAAADTVDAARRGIIPCYDLTAAEVDEGVMQIRVDGSSYVQVHTVVVAVKPPDPEVAQDAS